MKNTDILLLTKVPRVHQGSLCATQPCGSHRCILSGIVVAHDNTTEDSHCRAMPPVRLLIPLPLSSLSP